MLGFHRLLLAASLCYTMISIAPNSAMAQFEIIRDGTNSDYNANHWDFDGFPGRPLDSGPDEYGRIPGGDK